MKDNPVPTGIAALDQFLQGGLPRGFATIILAPSGAGAEIFAKQYAAGDPAATTTFVSTDESEAEVADFVDSMAWDFGHVTVTDVQSAFADEVLGRKDQIRSERSSPTRVRRHLDARTLVEGTSSLDFLREVSAERGDLDYLSFLLDPYRGDAPPDRLIVHSLDFFINLYPLETVIAVLTAMKAANAKHGGQLLWVLTQGAHGSSAEKRIELLGDCLIELEMTRKGTHFDRYCIVKKVRNRPKGIGVSTYEVNQHGFHIETLERIV